jgi:hypothetical protein
MQHLPRSLQPVALIAVRETGAGGCAICEVDADGAPRVVAAFGLPVPAVNENGVYVTSLPLHIATGVSGSLSFVFQTEKEWRKSAPLLERAARSIEAVWRLARLRHVYAETAAHIGELQAELVDSKIADRAKGLLEQTSSGRGGIETMERHIEAVLRAGQFVELVEKTSRDLKEELAERKVVQLAKSILRESYGMSEEQAHNHLRSLSRTSRRPLKDVARDLIGSAPASLNASKG